MNEYEQSIVIRYYGTITSGVQAGKQLDGYELNNDLSQGKSCAWTRESAVERAERDHRESFSGRIEVCTKQYNKQRKRFDYSVLHQLQSPQLA